LEDQWKEVGKVHELFCKRVMDIPLASADDACVNELWMKNRKEKILERVMKHCLRPLETHDTNPVQDALRQQKKEEGNNWMSTTKQELERLGTDDICETGRNNDKKIWIRTRKKKTC
jgi:hypothetical protein